MLESVSESMDWSGCPVEDVSRRFLGKNDGKCSESTEVRYILGGFRI